MNAGKKKNIFKRYLDWIIHFGNAAQDNRREMEQLSKDPMGTVEKYSIINRIKNNRIL